MRSAIRALSFAAAMALAAPALAQDGGEAGPEEIKKKILEIERLMRGAEDSLARSTDTRSAEERSAEAAKKMLEALSKKETGKTPEQLRSEAEAGSKEAKETIERLTKEAEAECRKAAEAMKKVLQGGSESKSSGEGVRELIEKIKNGGQGASEGIRWIIEKAQRQGGGGGGSSKKDHQPDAPDPRSGDKKDKPPPPDPHRPESNKEPPRTPQFEQWLAELPPQVRKAYETEDWDSIPPKWREMLREWTRKMADELEKSRR